MDAQADFSELLTSAQTEPVAIERQGEAVAVLLSAREYAEYEALKLARLRAEIQLGLDDVAAGRTVDAEEAFAAVYRALEGK